MKPWSGTQLSTRTHTTAILDSQGPLTSSLPLSSPLQALTLLLHSYPGGSYPFGSLSGAGCCLRRVSTPHADQLQASPHPPFRISQAISPPAHVSDPSPPFGPGSCSRNASSFFSLINLPHLCVNMLLSDHKHKNLYFPVSVLPHFLHSLE